MPVLALFGITNSGLNLFVNLVFLFLVVVWIALIAWTYLDARRRIEDPVLVACATGASLFPFVGSIVYSILRPPEFLEDAKERELEIRASELRVRQLEEQSCPNCGHPIERTYLRCPNCRARVKDPCDNCERPIDPRWMVCPYCEMPQRRAPEPPRRAAREERQREQRSQRPAQRPAKRPAARPAARTKTAESPRSRPTREARNQSGGKSATTRERKPPSRGRSSSDGGRDGGSEDRPRRRSDGGRDGGSEDRPRRAPAS